MRDATEIDWTAFLGRAAAELDRGIVEEFIRGKRVLITGAGGSIGSALARTLAPAGVDRLVLLDISEHGLFELGAVLNDGPEVAKTELIVGDVCDRSLLREVFTAHRPEVVFHAAAYKHVSLMESNPFAAARSNILGTHRLVQAANEARAARVIVVSTDKAVGPVGIMGATKRVAELLVLASAGPAQVKAVRLGNVLGSSGSVVPTFLRQIARGGPLTVTDRACTRYVLSMDEAVRHLVVALAVDRASTVLVPEMGGPVSVLELARFILGAARVEIVFSGMRPGEKLVEQVVASDETLVPCNVPLVQTAIGGRTASAWIIDQAIEEIEAATEQRQLGRLLRTIMALVSEYGPSRQIIEWIE